MYGVLGLDTIIEPDNAAAAAKARLMGSDANQEVGKDGQNVFKPDPRS